MLLPSAFINFAPTITFAIANLIVFFKIHKKYPIIITVFLQFFYQNRTHDMNNRDNTQSDTINKVQNPNYAISSVIPSATDTASASEESPVCDASSVCEASSVCNAPSAFDTSSASDASEDSSVSEAGPLISIITITYNAAPVIRPTLESLNAQTFRDFEHLVIDGASKDDTVSIVSEMCPDSIIRSEPDRGLYDAMNKGLRAAKGKYLLFLNAGDALHSPDTLQRYAEATGLNGSRIPNAMDNTDSILSCADIIYGDTVVVDSDRNFVKPRHLSVPERLTFRSFANGMLVCHQAFMVRRDLAPEYDLQYRFSADYEWTLRCLKSADPDHNVNLHTVTIDYLSDGMTDKNHSASLKERFRIMCRYYGTIPTLLRHIRFLLRHLIKL